MTQQLFAAFTMGDMQRLDAANRANFKRGKDKQKRKNRGLGLGGKLALGAAGVAGAGLAARYGMAAVGGAKLAGGRYGSAIGKMGLKSKAGIYAQGAKAGIGEAVGRDIQSMRGLPGAISKKAGEAKNAVTSGLGGVTKKAGEAKNAVTSRLGGKSTGKVSGGNGSYGYFPKKK